MRRPSVRVTHSGSSSRFFSIAVSNDYLIALDNWGDIYRLERVSTNPEWELLPIHPDAVESEEEVADE